MKLETTNIIRRMLKREHTTASRISVIMGNKDSYVSNILGRGSTPRCDTMANICDALGYDLVVRSRRDGYEYTIAPTKD